MKKLIAIHPDDYTGVNSPAESDASSPRWAQLLKDAGHEVRWVNVYRADILNQLEGCDAFMWRWAHFGGMFQIARRLLPVIELELKIPVYPDQNTCWYYDDKIAQSYLFEVLKIPSPRTWVWFSNENAEDWVQTATFPLVMKLAGGASSQNVRLIRDVREAEQWLHRLFDLGVGTLGSADKPWPWRKRIVASVKALIKGEPPLSYCPWPLDKNYVLFQEYLHDNAFDTRVTVIGNRAFAFRRFNRPDDFRASGSGIIDYTPEKIDPAFLRLAFDTATKLKSQSCAIDGLYRGLEPVVGEVSYTYVSSAVYACPGHWKQKVSGQGSELIWCSGSIWPEEAQIQDFLDRVAPLVSDL